MEGVVPVSPFREFNASSGADVSFEEKVRSIPEKANVDFVVAVSPENFWYVSQCHLISVEKVRSRQAFAILPRRGDPVLLVPAADRETAIEESWIGDVRAYTEFMEHPMDALASILKSMGLEKGKLGLDLMYLPHASWVRFQRLLPDAEILDTTDEIAEERALKSEREVMSVESAARATYEAAAESMAAARSGDSAEAMATHVRQKLIEKGATSISFLFLGTRPRTALAHGTTRSRVPGASEILCLHCGGSFGMWNSDLARVYSTGNPSAVQRKAYRDVRGIQEETIAAVRPGISAEEIFFRSKAAYARRNRGFTLSHVGHGLGIELREYPVLRPGNQRLIEKTMVLSVAASLRDQFGSVYRLEDSVLVSAEGTRVLSPGPAPDEIPTIGR
ncbi:MAG TPA: Xaa-Pro peptidase family protein [Thermodesulfobacteriota bacterium]|nr:Xaa-Pro peptidase family protein [Thermodesulfobacteriota bacterium]